MLGIKSESSARTLPALFCLLFIQGDYVVGLNTFRWFSFSIQQWWITKFNQEAKWKEKQPLTQIPQMKTQSWLQDFQSTTLVFCYCCWWWVGVLFCVVVCFVAKVVPICSFFLFIRKKIILHVNPMSLSLPSCLAHPPQLTHYLFHTLSSPQGCEPSIGGLHSLSDSA